MSQNFVSDLNKLKQGVLTANEAQSGKTVFEKQALLRGIVSSALKYFKDDKGDLSSLLLTPFQVFKSGDGFYDTSLTIENVRDSWCPQSASVAYVDPVSGNDANSGLDWANAKQSIDSALSTSSIIYISEGLHFPWSADTGAAKDYAVIGISDKSWVCYGNKPVWATNATHAHLRDGTGVGNISVVVRDDIKDERGSPMSLKEVGSLAECSITPESTYITANTCVVNSASLDSIVIVAYSNGNPYTGSSASGNIRYYEQLTVLGQPFKHLGNGTVNSKVCLNSVGVFYDSPNETGALFDIDGISETLLFNVIGSYARKDIFNYHILSGIVPKVYEVNCKGSYGGQSGAGPHQITTVHDGGSCIRINGDYSGSNQVIADTNLGTLSYSLGCRISNANDATVWSLDNAEMNLIDCVLSGNPSDAHLHADGGNINVIRTSKNSVLESNGGLILGN